MKAALYGLLAVWLVTSTLATGALLLALHASTAYDHVCTAIHK